MNPPDQSGDVITFSDKDWKDVFYALVWVSTALTWKHINKEYDEKLLNRCIPPMLDNNQEDDTQKMLSLIA